MNKETILSLLAMLGDIASDLSRASGKDLEHHINNDSFEIQFDKLLFDEYAKIRTTITMTKTPIK